MLSFPTIFANSRRRNIHVQPSRHSPRTAPHALRIFFRISPLRPAPAPSSGPATRPDSFSASSALVPQYPAGSPPTRHSPRTAYPRTARAARPRTLCGRPANPFLRLRPRNPLPATPALRATLPRSPACSALCAATRKRLRCMSYRGSPRSSLSALRRCSTASLTRSPPCPFPS